MTKNHKAILTTILWVAVAAMLTAAAEQVPKLLGEGHNGLAAIITAGVTTAAALLKQSPLCRPDSDACDDDKKDA